MSATPTVPGILVRDGYVVVELDKGYNAWVDEGHKVVK
jgi:rhodanese-related sulfurtransferase